MPPGDSDAAQPVPAREESADNQPRAQPGAAFPDTQSASAPSPPLTSPPSLVGSIAASLGLSGPLSPADLALFAEMLAGLVRAKLPLPDALKLVGKEAENRALREALEEVEKDVASGTALPEALRKREGKFPKLFTWLLEQGCAANDLHAALVELVREYRSQARREGNCRRRSPSRLNGTKPERAVSTALSPPRSPASRSR